MRLLPHIRQFTEKFKDQVAVVLLALLIGAFAFASISSYQVERASKSILLSHSTELARVAALTKQLNQDEKAIAKFATALETTSSANHTALAAICAALNITVECSAPSP